jgi:preprotein translocase subunit SecG
MLNVLLTVHMIACIALVIAIMLQRSEGGALGMGGGGTGGVISGRGAASVLVRTTMGLAAVFFATSITMTYLNGQETKAPANLERELQQQNTADPFDPLAGPSTTTPPATTTTPAGALPAAPTTPGATPAPAPVDPLAPRTNTAPAPATTTPRAATTPMTTPPATTPPAATPPQNGGSPN